MNILLGIIVTLLIIFVTPVFVYGLFSKFFGVQEPEKKLTFFVSVLVQKVGTSIGFVALFYMAREYFGTEWLAYGLIWFAMFAIVEVGQAMLPTYSKKEAAAGIVSELIYFPLAAFAVARLLT